MPASTLQSQAIVRGLFDELADLPPHIRETRMASLTLSNGDRDRLSSLFAFDALSALPAEVQCSRVQQMDLPEPIVLKVQAMLDTDCNRCVLQQSFAAGAVDLLRSDNHEQLEQSLLDTSIGTFRLTELLGEGGSATVFRAEREAGDGLQLVALKLLRSGIYSPESRRRFRREQSILAQLTHPNIARLIEGGVSSSGIPYIAMELVEGTPITLAADHQGLGINERLIWFSSLCRTIEAAHSALIVHRDLKPSNILITREGGLKVLDFGIAKLLEDDDETARTKAIVLTPEYAAPEQFGSTPLTTAVDVYALGMLLGELLTGRRIASNTRASSSVHVRPVGDADTSNGLPSPKVLARELRGDLDAVLEMALSVDPSQRYRSAGAFADDIERYLERLPVRARRPSHWYRAGKFLARHRLAAAVSTAVLLAVLSSLAIALWQARVARQEMVRANIVRDFVVGVFDSARASLPRDQRPTPESLVTQAAVQLETAHQLDAQTRADLNQTLGEVWLSLSSFAAADKAFDRALIDAKAASNPQSDVMLHILRADGWQRAGRTEEVIGELAPLVAKLRGQPSKALARGLEVLAAAELARSRQDRALRYQQDAAAVVAQLSGPGSIETVAAHLEVGVMLAASGEFADAIVVIEPLLAQWRALRAPDDERYVRGLSALLDATDALGQYEQSEDRVREIIQIKRRIYPPQHDTIAKSLRDLAHMLEHKGDFPGAETLLDEALSMQRRVLGNDHVEVVQTLDALGLVRSAQRRFPEAEYAYRSAITSCTRMRTHEDDCARVHNNLGQSYYFQDRFAEAEREMQIALAMRRRLYGKAHPSVAMSMSTLANVAAIRGHSTRAIELSARALAILVQNGHGQSREAALARNGYADVLERAGRHAAALQQVDRALDDWRRTNPDEKIRRILMLSLKGQILKNLHRREDVQQIVSEISEIGVSQSELKPSAIERLRDLTIYAAVQGPRSD